MILKKIAEILFNKLPLWVRCRVQSIRLGGMIIVGQGSYIHPSVHLLGKNNISIGSNTCISEGCWLNVNHKKDSGVAIEVGDNCFIGKQNFFTSGDIIQIGDYTLTTIGCKFIGSTHRFDNPEIPYLLTGTTSEDRIQIGVNCFFGAGSTVLGNVKIGHGSVIGANSLVLNDIPPFSIAVGNPATVIKRYSFSKKAWVQSSDHTLIDDIGLISEEEYLDQLKAKFPHVNLPWFAAGKSMGNL
jgi:acetyltransferase-like isoleucine patch superfamily enzyme